MVADADFDVRVAGNVLDPIGAVKPFREDVERAAVDDEPDFDLAWKARLAPDRRQIQVGEVANRIQPV